MKSKDVLVITAMDGADNFAQELAARLGCRVEIALTHRAGLQCVRQGEFAVVVVEESMVESDPEWADTLWSSAGPAIPLQANFSITSGPRLAREVKSAMARLEEEQAVARRFVTAEMENELRSSLTGLLLQSELALREPKGSSDLAPKLKRLVELAETIRSHFDEGPRKQ